MQGFKYIAVCAAVLAVFLAATIAAVSVPTSHVVHEKRDIISHTWSKRDRVASHVVLPVRIGLKQTNLENAYEHLMDVSHPASPNYGRHWTSDDVARMFAPSEEAVKLVQDWLLESGIASHRIVHSNNKGWLAFDATAEELERLLYAEFHEYNHYDDGSIRIGCDAYHVPGHITEHVDYITPGLKLSPRLKRSLLKVKSRQLLPLPDSVPDLSRRSSSSGVAITLAPELRNCTNFMTPACVRALYNIPKASKAHPKNSLGIFESLYTYDQKDLDWYFGNFTPEIPRGTHPRVLSINGGKAPLKQGDPYTYEGTRNAEIAYSMIYPQSITMYQTDDGVNFANFSGYLNTFLDALDGSYCTYCAYGECGNDPKVDKIYPDTAPGGYKGKLMCGVYKPTNVITITYNEAEHDLPSSYQKRQCFEFLKLGLQGHSVVVVGGEFGVVTVPGDDSANGCLGKNATIFNPLNPANCPYVTAVGVTQFYPSQTIKDPESGLDAYSPSYTFPWSSGGGFANYFQTPYYQSAAVAKFFDTAKPTYPYYNNSPDFTQSHIGEGGGIYNRVGRGFPDVSINGYRQPVIYYGVQKSSLGTSYSTPLFASLINLINEERLAANKSTVGFLNPVFYDNPHIFNDITNGTQPNGCGTDGFSAVKGWDPVTGDAEVPKDAETLHESTMMVGTRWAVLFRHPKSCYGGGY